MRGQGCFGRDGPTAGMLQFCEVRNVPGLIGTLGMAGDALGRDGWSGLGWWGCSAGKPLQQCRLSAERRPNFTSVFEDLRKCIG